MPKKTTTKKEETRNEFKFEASNGNVFEGIRYGEKEGKNCTITGLSLTINGLAIRGCSLVESKKGNFISFPQYQDKDGEYHSFVYFYKKEDMEDLKEFVNYLMGDEDE